MANLKETLKTLRDNFSEAADDSEMGKFDTALSQTLLGLLDGDTAPEPPKKRPYVRKNKVTDPPAE